VPIALPLLGGFAVGLALRALLQRHFAHVFRTHFALGMGTLAVLAGWGFHAGLGALAALALLLVAQLAALGLGSRLFRGDREGPVMAFGMFGNPTFWSLPIVAATLGADAAVVLAAYDMLTMPRIALGVRLMRGRAPLPQAPRTALTDYAPMVGAVAGLLLARLVPAPGVVPDLVAGLGLFLSITGAVLLGVAWPRGRWLGRPELHGTARTLALHLTFVPAVLGIAALAGLAIPPGVWVLVLGPLPISSLSFARIYGYSDRQAATAIGASVLAAVALLPLALALGGS
jgi:predicted permease